MVKRDLLMLKTTPKTRQCKRDLIEKWRTDGKNEEPGKHHQHNMGQYCPRVVGQAEITGLSEPFWKIGRSFGMLSTHLHTVRGVSTRLIVSMS